MAEPTQGKDHETRPNGDWPNNLGGGGVEAIKMAIADLGGTVLGRRTVLLISDHQNKADAAASKVRE